MCGEQPGGTVTQRTRRICAGEQPGGTVTQRTRPIYAGGVCVCVAAAWRHCDVWESRGGLNDRRGLLFIEQSEQPFLSNLALFFI